MSIDMSLSLKYLFLFLFIFLLVFEHHTAGKNKHGRGDRHLRDQVPGEAGQAGPGDGQARPLQLHPHEVHPP